MQLTPKRIAAIKAIADDERGDPNTRAVARRKLEQLRREQPEAFLDDYYERARKMNDDIIRRYTNNPPNPRMRPAEDFTKWRFMNTDQWKRTPAGNYTIILLLEHQQYRVTVFRSKARAKWEGPGWGWVRSGPIGASKFSAGRFETFVEAQRDAWNNLSL